MRSTPFKRNVNQRLREVRGHLGQEVKQRVLELMKELEVLERRLAAAERGELRIAPAGRDDRHRVDAEEQGQADQAAEAMDEIISVTCLINHLARCLVEVFVGDTRPDHGKGGLLRAQNDVVDLALFRSVFAIDRQCAGNIGRVM